MEQLTPVAKAKDDLNAVIETLVGVRTKLKDMVKRLRLAAKRAKPVDVVDGERYTEEGWMSDTIEPPIEEDLNELLRGLHEALTADYVSQIQENTSRERTGIAKKAYVNALVAEIQAHQAAGRSVKVPRERLIQLTTDPTPLHARRTPEKRAKVFASFFGLTAAELEAARGRAT